MKIKNIPKLISITLFEDFVPVFNDMVDQLNVALVRMSFDGNFNKDTKEITIPSGVELAIPHNLKVTPKYRIIVRQRGNSLITDGEAAWTDKVIYLKNNGANDVTLTVIILRS